MNLLGKIFVVLIIVMSLVFMTLALAVYATHKNWKDIVEGPNGLKTQLDHRPRPACSNKVDEYNRLESQLKGEARIAPHSKFASSKPNASRWSIATPASNPSSTSSRPNAATPPPPSPPRKQNNQRLADEVTGLRARHPHQRTSPRPGLRHHAQGDRRPASDQGRARQHRRTQSPAHRARSPA